MVVVDEPLPRRKVKPNLAKCSQGRHREQAVKGRDVQGKAALVRSVGAVWGCCLSVKGE